MKMPRKLKPTAIDAIAMRNQAISNRLAATKWPEMAEKLLAQAARLDAQAAAIEAAL
jgi:hypothetical protein